MVYRGRALVPRGLTRFYRGRSRFLLSDPAACAYPYLDVVGHGETPIISAGNFVRRYAMEQFEKDTHLMIGMFLVLYPISDKWPWKVKLEIRPQKAQVTLSPRDESCERTLASESIIDPPVNDGGIVGFLGGNFDRPRANKLIYIHRLIQAVTTRSLIISCIHEGPRDYSLTTKDGPMVRDAPSLSKICNFLANSSQNSTILLFGN